MVYHSGRHRGHYTARVLPISLRVCNAEKKKLIFLPPFYFLWFKPRLAFVRSKFPQCSSSLLTPTAAGSVGFGLVWFADMTAFRNTIYLRR
ncbi:hypothetical protein K440DRAFT_109144 [Wilcoxina mikolae CBS 423.85]|nr:hypothetical protein K440DRAFT_109144 [Wilcoxina mikolae CBS 423.85]